MLNASDIVLRRTKGALVTRDELDDNFDKLRVFANLVEVKADGAATSALQATTIGNENRSLIQALTSAFEGIDFGDTPPPNVIVNYFGSRINRSSIEPTVPPEGWKVGDMWVQEGQPLSLRFRYWNGTTWELDPIAIDKADFAFGLVPIEVLTVLPPPGNPPRVVLLTTDMKQYIDKGTHWERRIAAADIEGELLPVNFGNRTITGEKIAINAIDAGHINAGVITSTHLAADTVVITNALQVGVGTVSDSALMAGISANKIAVGKLAAVDIAIGGGVYDAAYPSNVFQRFAWANNGPSSLHNFGVGDAFTFNHANPCTYYGPGVNRLDIEMQWRNQFSIDGTGRATFLIAASIHNYSGDIMIYLERNGSMVYEGLWHGPGVVNGGGASIVPMFVRQIWGLNKTDTLRFRAAPINGAHGPFISNFETFVNINMVALNS